MEIINAIKAREKAVRNHDIEGTLAFYHPQVIVFDVVQQLQHQGLEAVRNRLKEWFGTLATIIDFEIRVLHAAAENNIAWCATLNHIVAETHQAGKLDMWWRETACYTRQDNLWLITHAHSSVPFDTSTGMASLKLQP